MSSRANLIKSAGLLTNGSELSRREGSLTKATNVNIDENGVITQRRGFADYGNATDEITSKPIKQLIEYKQRLFRHFEDQIEFEDENGQFQSIAGSYTEVRNGYRIKYQEDKGNMYFTTEEGIKRISVAKQSDLTSTSTVTIEQSGVPKAAYMEGSSVDTVGGFLPAQSKVGYRFLFGRKDNNNNLLLGSPSAREIVTNSNQRDVQFEDVGITIDENTGSNVIQDRDYIVISTLDRKYTLYFNVTGGSVLEPKNSDTLGSVFIEIDISNVSATYPQRNEDIAATLANDIANNVPNYEVSLSINQIDLVSSEEGDIDNPVKSFANEAGSNPVNIVTSDGSVTEGLDANCTLTLILPSSITTDYFVQVYRTPTITAIEGLTLDDIDPGDETNIVYEASVTSDNITDGEIIFTDTTPESFRAAGAALYTNAITGEGILQSNDPPPIALDIALFRNSLFYANTKSAHRGEFDILSVDNFVSNSTRIIIGNSTVTRYYTANLDTSSGDPDQYKEDSEIPDTIEGGKFFLSPSISVGQAIDQTARSLVKIINQDSSSPVNAFYLTGADDLPGQLLFEARDLSDDTLYFAVEEDSFAQIGQEFSPEIPVSKQISRLRGNTLDTILTLTGHGFSTGDQKFISFLSDGDIHAPDSFSGVYTITKIGVDEFSIKIPLATSVDSDDVSNGFSVVNTAVFSPDFESDNLEIPNRIYYSKLSEPEAVPVANFIDVGAKDEEIKRILALRDNLFVLKDDGIYIVSGTSAPNFSVRLLDNTRILAPDSAVVLNNQIYCLTEQGITIVTDSGAGVISRGIENLIDDVVNSNFDYTLNTFGVAYENDRAYIMFTPQTVDDTSATQAYRYNIFERTWSRWEYEATCGLVMERDNKFYVGNGGRNFVGQERKNFDRTDHADRDFVIQISADGVDGNEVEISNTDDIEIGDVITQTQEVSVNYINNRLLRRMDTFDTGITLGSSGGIVTYPNSSTANFFSPYPHRLENLSTWTVTITDTEPKTFTEDYIVTVVDANNFTIQYDSSSHTIGSATFRDYYIRTFAASNGDNMVDVFQLINDHLFALDPWDGVSGITDKLITSNNVLESVNTFVDQLNLVETITTVKTYTKPESVTYEAYIRSVDITTNKITLHAERPFLQDDITVYKHIEKVIQWNPQHFGDPSALKQVREVTILFDQNNFYDAIARFGSDVRQALTDVPFQGKGIGYWGDMTFDDPNAYWGGEGNDIPFRTIVPADKQRCRYITVVFEHSNAREEFRILGVTGVIRPISSRAYR